MSVRVDEGVGGRLEDLLGSGFVLDSVAVEIHEAQGRVLAQNIGEESKRGSGLLKRLSLASGRKSNRKSSSGLLFKGMQLGSRQIRELEKLRYESCSVYQQVRIGVVGVGHTKENVASLNRALCMVSAMFPGMTKLLDFGIVESAEDPGQVSSLINLHHVNVLVVCGGNMEEMQVLLDTERVADEPFLFAKVTADTQATLVVYAERWLEEERRMLEPHLVNAVARLGGRMDDLSLSKVTGFLVQDGETSREISPVMNVFVGSIVGAGGLEELSVKNYILTHLGCRAFKWVVFETVEDLKSMFESVCNDTSELSMEFDLFVFEDVAGGVIMRNELEQICRDTKCSVAKSQPTALYTFGSLSTFLQARTKGLQRELLCLTQNTQERDNEKHIASLWAAVERRCRTNRKRTSV